MTHIQQFKTSLIHQIGDGENIAFDFFITFSRMEFALKHTNYAKADARRNAIADWDKFANQNDEEFQRRLANKEDKTLIIATDYLFNTPPKRLKFVENHLSWEKRDVIKNKTLKELLLIIRGIRNNLFHGSKRLAIAEQSRNRNLLNYGLIILNECLQINQDLRQKFLEEIGQ